MQAAQIGPQSVLFFVLGGQWAVSEAQPPDVFRQVFAQLGAWQGSAPASGGDACGPEGCEV